MARAPVLGTCCSDATRGMRSTLTTAPGLFDDRGALSRFDLAERGAGDRAAALSLGGFSGRAPRLRRAPTWAACRRQRTWVRVITRQGVRLPGDTPARAG